ncbi:dihydropteroate synthase-related protein [Archaeoglobus sulfaticallidus PM70-1]|uniref:Dihydropteroate synthase-related protein n=1 Tax=Archaeoglobus sulfaticallidus PM70-1 TaxID=387631 RepID=N0BNI9_9EURY|nr:dihydropteroate synthase-like protein [Archaeoglobus sulfaticallidus]AGK62231.1 dihydropteroate synthase-related protein [Archaeoglobus sulfaticallidus PM70-1]
MKILTVTGRLAEKDVRKYVSGFDVDVFVADIDVAAFIQPKHIERLDLSNYDLVLVPGLTSADWKAFEKRKGTMVRLGPIHAYDLKSVIPLAEKIEFSHTIPACRLIQREKERESIDAVDSLGDFAFRIGDVEIGGNTRMKVVAEIVDATRLSENELAERLRYYEEHADIIDLGIPLDEKPEEVERTVEFAKKITRLPLSIDTFDERLIEAAINKRIDMVMSISSKNLSALDYIDDQAVVVVGRSTRELLELTDTVRDKTSKVIADPVLDPPLNLAESIMRYAEYRKADSITPMLFGIGNVTELVDSDSIGINAVLAFIAEELSANLLFTTEASVKTTGSIRELKIASYMAKAAKIRNSSPKDLGINLLALKEKTRLESCKIPENFIEGQESREFIRDPCGDFRIWISEGRIVCSHDRAVIVGRTAKEIYDAAVKMGLLSRLDHACYLGRELAKAEIALKLGKNYTQDRDLDFGFYTRGIFQR